MDEDGGLGHRGLFSLRAAIEHGIGNVKAEDFNGQFEPLSKRRMIVQMPFRRGTGPGIVCFHGIGVNAAQSKRSNLVRPYGEDLFQLKARMMLGTNAFDDFWVFGQLDVIVVDQRQVWTWTAGLTQQQDVVGIEVNVFRSCQGS